MLDEIADGRRRLDELFGNQALPVFTPPWNRIAPEVVEGLSGSASQRSRPSPRGRQIRRRSPASGQHASRSGGLEVRRRSCSILPCSTPSSPGSLRPAGWAAPTMRSLTGCSRIISCRTTRPGRSPRLIETLPTAAWRDGPHRCTKQRFRGLLAEQQIFPASQNDDRSAAPVTPSMLASTNSRLSRRHVALSDGRGSYANLVAIDAVPNNLLAFSSFAERFTMAPMTVTSRRSRSPTAPNTIGPAETAMPIPRCANGASLRSSGQSRMSPRMASIVAQRVGSVAFLTGAPRRRSP